MYKQKLLSTRQIEKLKKIIHYKNIMMIKLFQVNFIAILNRAINALQLKRLVSTFQHEKSNKNLFIRLVNLPMPILFVLFKHLFQNN